MLGGGLTGGVFGAGGNFGGGGYGGGGYGGGRLRREAMAAGTAVSMAVSTAVATGRIPMAHILKAATRTCRVLPFGTPGAPGTAAAATGAHQTGAYLSSGTPGAAPSRMPRIVPNQFDNTILWCKRLPRNGSRSRSSWSRSTFHRRQVLIEAKIYSVELTGAFQAGVNSAFQGRQWAAGRIAVVLSQSWRNRCREPRRAGGFGFNRRGLGRQASRASEFSNSAAESSSLAKVIAEPSVIATDSVQASINVGATVPTLSSQAVGGAQVAGNSLFTNTISNVSTGTTLSILARVNPSGIVTMVINQQVSDPQQPSSSSAIQSPSFSQKAISTQVTVQDGDTIAIGGIIQETNTEGSSGSPVLHKLPVVGPLFGTKTTSKDRTELVIFLTPHVIYDTNQAQEATHDLEDQMKRLKKMYRP